MFHGSALGSYICFDLWLVTHQRRSLFRAANLMAVRWAGDIPHLVMLEMQVGEAGCENREKRMQTTSSTTNAMPFGASISCAGIALEVVLAARLTSIIVGAGG